MHSAAAIVRRGVALTLDFVFLSAFFFPVTYLYSGKWIMGPEEHLWGFTDPLCILFLVIMFAYFVLAEAYAGRTVGKRIVGLKVTDAAGNTIGLNRSLARNLLRVVDGLPALYIVGAILIAGSPHNQRFGDRVAHAYVVKT
ncbi:MAG: RDD family protein [Chloroflexota bacterium]